MQAMKCRDNYNYSSFLSNNQTSIGETEAPSDHNSIIIETGEMNRHNISANILTAGVILFEITTDFRVSRLSCKRMSHIHQP